MTVGGLDQVDQQETERGRRRRIGTVAGTRTATSAMTAERDLKFGGTGSRTASTPLTLRRRLSHRLYIRLLQIKNNLALTTLLSSLYRRFEIRNSLTRFRTDRDGLTVGNSSKIHCNRVRMRSLEAVSRCMIGSQLEPGS